MVPNELLSDFAEVCGIHAGDGWMSSYTNEIGYGTNPKEEQYFQDVLQLYKRIFGFERHRILRRLAVELRFQSEEGQALLQSVGFARGKKLDALRVPAFVFHNKEFMRRFLRGVVDTDGNVYWRKGVNQYSLVISWATTAPLFAKDILTILQGEGYHPQISSISGTQCDGRKRRMLHRIILMRQAEVKRFLEEIGFRNKRRWVQVTKRFEDLEQYKLNTSTTTFLSSLRISESGGPVV